MEKAKTRSAKRVSEPKVAEKSSIVKKVASKIMSVASSPKQKISADEYIQRVQFRAYENYVNRGFTHGNDLDDWLEAERQVKADLGL